MSKKELSAGEGSIDTIHREFKGGNFGWNTITWLIELEQPVQVNVAGASVMVDYFVVSNDVDSMQTIVFPVNDVYHPLKHKGVVGNNGWSIRKAVEAFREWLDLRPDVRAMQEVTL